MSPSSKWALLLTAILRVAAVKESWPVAGSSSGSCYEAAVAGSCYEAAALDQHGRIRNDRSPLADVIVPQFLHPSGEPALTESAYVVDFRQFNASGDALDFDGELAHAMRATYDRLGLVVVKHTGLTDLGLMRTMAKHVVETEIVYEGGANPRGSLQPNVYEVGAPLEAWLHYHHEMAYVAHSTTMLGFMCSKPLEGRGATYVSDNLAATKELLATPFGQKLKDKGICYHRDLTDRTFYEGKEEVNVYNHWQLSMLTEDPEEAVRVAESRGLTVTWGPNGLLKTVYCTSAFEYHPKTGKNLLYASVADDGMWFDTWDKVQHLPMEERPLSLKFGDGTDMTRDEKQQFVTVYDNHGTAINWEQGDVAIIDNYLFAHGRPSIYLQEGEERELGVILGASFERVLTRKDAW